MIVTVAFSIIHHKMRPANLLAEVLRKIKVRCFVFFCSCWLETHVYRCNFGEHNWRAFGERSSFLKWNQTFFRDLAKVYFKFLSRQKQQQKILWIIYFFIEKICSINCKLMFIYVFFINCRAHTILFKFVFRALNKINMKRFG